MKPFCYGGMKQMLQYDYSFYFLKTKSFVFKNTNYGFTVSPDFIKKCFVWEKGIGFYSFRQKDTDQESEIFYISFLYDFRIHPTFTFMIIDNPTGL